MTDILAQARDVVLGYGTPTTIAVDALTFTIPHRAVTAIIGPNGSGKSTLLNAVAGVLTPLAGELSVLGGSAQARPPRTSYVMQSLSFPAGTPITVREAVGMGLWARLGWFRRPTQADSERVESAMARLDVTSLADRHLDELSGGQRQRVYVAQGLAQHHDAILLDEPLTGLDITSARTIDEIIHSERERGHAVVLTTHDLDEARAADWVVLMNGRCVAFGPPARVLTTENLTRAYGLGSLHEAVETPFLDDPHDEGQGPMHEHGRHHHPH